MGMQIFEQSGTFRPSDWGLNIGDMLQIIAVGGGGGGNGSASYDSNDSGSRFDLSNVHKGGDAGKAGGNEGGGYPGGGGAGYGGGGGGGGRAPNLPPSSGSNRGTIGNSNGGGAGQIKTATHKLTSLSAIAVTVGLGGQGAQMANRNDTTGTNGGSSSFGSVVTAQGGLGGGANNGGGYGWYGNHPSYSYTPGGGGGGDGGYVVGGPLQGGFGGRGDTPKFHQTGDSTTGTTQYWTHLGESGSHTGGCGGAPIADIEIAPDCIGGLPGQDGGPGHGVVIVCW